MWNDVVPGLVAGVIALAGVLVTQWRADVREEKRLAWEENRATTAWRRDRRLEAYTAFLSELLKLEDRLVTSPGNPPENWLDQLHNLATNIQVFGSPAAYDAANDLIEGLDNASTSDSWQWFHERVNQYVFQIRADLAVEGKRPPKLGG